MTDSLTAKIRELVRAVYGHDHRHPAFVERVIADAVLRARDAQVAPPPADAFLAGALHVLDVLETAARDPRHLRRAERARSVLVAMAHAIGSDAHLRALPQPHDGDVEVPF